LRLNLNKRKVCFFLLNNKVRLAIWTIYSIIKNVKQLTLLGEKEDE
jgi:hypothetical protein